MDFYWAHEGGKPLTPEELLRVRGPQLQNKARFLQDLIPGRLLDVGAQKGEFVHWMRLHGWDAQGQDFQPLPGNPFNVPMRYGDLTTIDWGEEKFDVITVWAVLEHIAEPQAFMRQLATLLKPRGRLIVLVTNFNSIQARLFKQDDFPRHLTLFTRRSARTFLSRYGMRVVRTSTDQRVFGGRLNGGLVYALKRCFGYTEHEAMHEWRYAPDPLAFCAKWHGREAPWLLWVSRLDRLMTWVPERVLDATGFGFVLTIEAVRD
jgi:SAM-dependent methyltransferase